VGALRRVDHVRVLLRFFRILRLVGVAVKNAAAGASELFSGKTNKRERPGSKFTRFSDQPLRFP
jgi:hypothetical protein